MNEQSILFREESLWSKWTTLKGRWDSKEGRFTNIKEESSSRCLGMRIVSRGGAPILEFLGGPTGFESYYVSDLLDEKYGLESNPSPILAINAGTINSWPRCEVDSQRVITYLKNFVKGDKKWQKSI